MTRILTALAVSVDGYIAGPNDGPGNPLGDGGQHLFDWYFEGDTPSRHYSDFRLSATSAELFDSYADTTGAVIAGRRTYDIANGWGGTGPLPGAKLFVMTHSQPATADRSYTFVNARIDDAIDQARAVAYHQGDRNVALMGSTPVRQALAAGLLDELTLHQVPILLGGGVRLLDGVRAELRLTREIAAPGVTHLTYDVLRNTAL